MQYDKKDIPVFQEQVCKKTCLYKGECIKEGKDNDWYLMCPHYFNWKLGIKSFVIEQLKWGLEHPEEAEAKYKTFVEQSKTWKASKKKATKKK